jgi:sialate O-acetylesterase
MHAIRSGAANRFQPPYNMQNDMRTLITLLLAAATLPAAVKLPALISDHMVLQEGRPVRIWGTADAGETVQVALQTQSVSVKAGADGKWTAWLRPLMAGGPLDLTIDNIAIHDVLVGEVWLGSGQSNIEFRLATAVNHDDEIAAANYPLIHLFQVKHAVAEQPLDDVVGQWQVCTPATVKSFSAVEYFFGRHLQQNLHVPMGLIESDWGGTPAQSWISHPALENDAALKYVLDEWDTVMTRYPAAKQRYDDQLTEWNRTSAEAKAQGKTAPNRPNAPAGPGHPNTPAGLYNGMIAPLTPYAIRGAIWYQGESNANEPHAFRYRRLFGGMIEDWRDKWGEGDFPFLFVQLANYQTNGWWPVLRESQSETLRLANTGMALAIDVGEPKDIHPKNKQDVGLRLALAARAIAYHQPVEYSGPMFQTAATEGGAMRAYFTHADGMRAAGGAAIAGFEIAGADGKFVAAQARVEGDTVVASNPQVDAPVAVRYGWADDPGCNLVKDVGLPASPFRSVQQREGK